MHNVKQNMRCRILRVEIAVPADIEDGEVRDGISALLTEGGICGDDGIVLDWRYIDDKYDMNVVASDDPEEGEIFNLSRELMGKTSNAED